MVNDLVRNTKEIYFSSAINNHGNQRVLFHAINNLLLKTAEALYPTACSDADLAQ